LSPEALAILRRIRKADPKGEGPWIGQTYDSFKGDWKRILEAAEITDFRRHDLRHTFGSYTFRETKNLVTVQELMGHANIATTKRYMHAFDEDKLEAVEAVGKVLGARNS
jgi:integrase